MNMSTKGISYTEINCPACSSSQHIKLASAFTRENSPAQLVICTNCSLAYNRYAQNLNYSNYSQYKERTDHNSIFLNRISSTSHAFKRFSWIIKEMREANYKFPSNVLEIGTYDGANLYPFHLLGLDVFGIDKCDDAFAPALKLGISLSTNLNTCKNFDLIIVSHVLEHVDNISDFIQFIKSYTHENSLIFFEVPGFDSWYAKPTSKPSEGYAATNSLRSFLVDEHINYFTKGTLLKILYVNNLYPFSFDSVPRVLCSVTRNNDYSQYIKSSNQLIVDQLHHFKDVRRSRYIPREILIKVLHIILARLSS